jgi:hypothetical protein
METRLRDFPFPHRFPIQSPIEGRFGGDFDEDCFEELEDEIVAWFAGVDDWEEGCSSSFIREDV